MPVKAGVIGVGYLGVHHARIYSELEDVELVGVMDTSAERCNEIADTYGCDCYDNIDQLIKDSDALSIVTPTPFHHSIGMKCLNHSKDILIEKPISVTIEEADDLIHEADKNGLILQVGHLERFNSAVMVLENYLEEPVFFESERLSPYLERAAGVDVTLDLMIHDIDIILSLSGSHPNRVSAVGSSVLSERIDVAKAWIEFENGISALVSAGRLSRDKTRRLKIFQKDSHLILDYQNAMIQRHYKTDSGKIMHDVIKPEVKEPLMEELVDFIQCINTRTRPVVSGVEARDALNVALTINEQLNRSIK